MKQILRGSPIYYERVEGVKLGSSPIDFIAVNLPPICNYRCKKCSTSADKDKAMEKALPLERVLELIDEARDLGARTLAISGEGEPLAVKTLPQIIQHTYDLGLTTVMATNGSLLTEETLRFLKDHDVTLTISLDTLDKEKYESHCQREGTFDNVLKNIELCRQVYGDTSCSFSDYQVFRASVHSIVSSENIEEIEALKRNCGNDMFFSLGYLAPVGNARDNQQLLEDYDEVRRRAEEATELFLKCKNNEGRTVCGFFYHGIAVGYDGEILLDAHALDTTGIIGNVRDEPLAKFIPKIKSTIAKFYEIGDCFCPIRDQNYGRFVEMMKND